MKKIKEKVNLWFSEKKAKEDLGTVTHDNDLSPGDDEIKKPLCPL